MFSPPRCPYLDCPQHFAPAPRFCRRHGTYLPKCRSQPVPRFRCCSCRRSFSRQTFRMDYRDHRPDLNAELFRSIASGVGLRQTARNLRMSLRCTELKFRKIARHLRRLNLNLRGTLDTGAVLQFDEFETFEGCRNTRPLSVPMLIEKRTRFVIWAESATIRPRGRMTPARRRRIADQERRSGARKDRSQRAIRRTLARGAALVEGHRTVSLQTDLKPSYARIAREVYGAGRVIHGRTSSRRARTRGNPLFAINHTEAMARDLTGRLRRRSWLASKKGRYLDLGLQLWAAWRNYVRRRFNLDRAAPAQMLGFTSKRMSEGELLTWRQDWGRESIPTLARAEHLIAGWGERRRRTV